MTMTTATPIGETAKKLLHCLKVDDSKPSKGENSIDLIYCEAKCKGLEQCQFGEGGRGYEPTTAYYDFAGQPVPYIIYTKCKYKVLAERREAEDKAFEASGLPLKQRGLKLTEVEAAEDTKILAAGFILGKLTDFEIESYELAIAIGNELIKRHIGVKYVTAPELLTDLRYDNEEYSKNLAKYLQVEVLIVNLQRTWRGSEYNREQLEMVMERRERVSRRTLRVGRI